MHEVNISTQVPSLRFVCKNRRLDTVHAAVHKSQTREWDEKVRIRGGRSVGWAVLGGQFWVGKILGGQSSGWAIYYSLKDSNPRLLEPVHPNVLAANLLHFVILNAESDPLRIIRKPVLSLADRRPQ